MEVETIQAYVSLIKDIITGVAAIIAAVIAIVGLQTWKKQLRGNAEYDLARRILVAVYKVRDAINHFRLFDDRPRALEKTKKFHDKVMAEIDAADASLKVELLEAEAVWGDEKGYKIGFVLFNTLVNQVKFAYWHYYFDNTGPNDKEDDKLILFSEIRPHTDEFSIRIENAVERIEDVLRPKLTLKPGKVKRKQ